MENLNEPGRGSVENVESDSGDSLFLTQKPTAHPVRSTRSPHLSLRSTPLSPRFLESTSSSESEPEDVPKRRKKWHLPKYIFPFLKQKKSTASENGSLGISSNRAIHYCGMAGFFKCVEEMSSGNARESTLPTVDSENLEITPITEDEKSDEEDFRIVSKKQFLYSLKPTITKCSQPWFKSLKNKVSLSAHANEAKLQGHFRTKRKSQSTSSASKGLSNKQQKDLGSSDSDATLIEDYEPSTSSKTARNHTVTSETTVKQTSMNIEKVLSSSQETDNTQSQSLVQCNTLDRRGSSQDSVYSGNNLHQSGKKRGKSKRTEGGREYQDPSLSQESRQSQTQWEKDRDLYEKPTDGEENQDEPLFVSSNTEREGNGQSLYEETVQPFCPDVHLDKRKKKKTENTSNSLNVELFYERDNGQTDDFTEVEREGRGVSDGKREKSQKKRKANPRDERDVTSRKLQMNNTDIISSESVGSGGECELVVEAATQSDEPVSVRKKKKVPSAAETLKRVHVHQSQSDGADERGIKTNHVESTETNCDKTQTPSKPDKNHFKTKYDAEQQPDGGCDLESSRQAEPKKRHRKKNGDVENSGNILNLDQLQMVDNTETGDITVQDKEVSEMGVRKRKKRKKMKKAEISDCINEEYTEIKKLELNKTDKKSLLKQSETPETSELLDQDNTVATDCVVAQSDEPVSVRKKKRKASSVAERVENANEPFAASAPGHGADEPGISTNDSESAQADGLLQQTELGNKRKKKKKKKQKKDDNVDCLGVNGNLECEPTESINYSGSKECDSEVAPPDSADRVKKKKKKKKSIHESLQPDIEVTSQRQTSEVEESAILSPNRSKRKKKKYHDNDEGEVVETELEQTTEKRKKIKKNGIENVDQMISSPSHGEMSTSCGKQKKSSYTKTKKKLYNPSSEDLLEERLM